MNHKEQAFSYFRGDITEDDERKAEEDIQKMTDKTIKEIDAVCEAKEKEIMEV